MYITWDMEKMYHFSHPQKREKKESFHTQKDMSAYTGWSCKYLNFTFNTFDQCSKLKFWVTLDGKELYSCLSQSWILYDVFLVWQVGEMGWQAK